MTFLLPPELADPEARPGLEMAERGARASGTPFLSFFTPPEILALAHEAGFKEARHVSAADPDVLSYHCLSFANFSRRTSSFSLGSAVANEPGRISPPVT